MIELRWKEGHEPIYQTEYSAGADLVASEDVLIAAGQRAKVATGVWIDKVLWEEVPKGSMPELQIRARSGLAIKHGICLSNGVGTVDLDYPNEIAVLLSNTSSTDFRVHKGDRIAQMVLSLTHRVANASIGGKRTGGFGSTKV